LVGELLERSVTSFSERQKILKDSVLSLNSKDYKLDSLLPMSQKIAAANREPALQTRFAESFNAVGAGGTSDSFNAIKGLDKTWMSALKHTKSLESLYLHIDNAPFANTVRKYTEKPGHLIMFEAGANSTEGSLGFGQRTVIMGKETTSPQGYMQSVRLMAGDRIDNVLLASSTQNQDQMLKAAQFEHGRRVLDSMPAYEVLEKQIKGQPWEDKLISRSGLETINEAKSKLQNMKSNEEYRDAALSLTTELGKKSIEVELSSPSPY
jgi:hypothetical protein